MPGAEAFRRNDDPRNSHDAIASYEPVRGTKRERVLAFLQEHEGEWVDAVDLTAPEIGGFQATRRCRELRAAGEPVVTRAKPGAPNTWQWRYVVAEDRQVRRPSLPSPPSVFPTSRRRVVRRPGRPRAKPEQRHEEIVTDQEVRRFGAKVKPPRAGTKAWKEMRARQAEQARAKVAAHQGGR